MSHLNPGESRYPSRINEMGGNWMGLKCVSSAFRIYTRCVSLVSQMKMKYGPDGYFKVCPRCNKVAFGKRWGMIVVDFGRNAARADGLQVLCRECRKRPKLRVEGDVE